MSFPRELGAAVRISVAGIRYRAGMSLSTVVGVMLVVLVLIGFLSMANGFQKMLAGTGSPGVAVILGKDSVNEMSSSIPVSEYRLLQDLPQIARRGGAALLSSELYEAVGATRTSGQYSGLTLRGMGAAGPALRPSTKLLAGRWFSPGSHDIVVGKSVVDGFQGFSLGQQVTLAGSRWDVVGIFESPGTVWDSEVWTDLQVIQSVKGAGASVQSIRAQLNSAGDMPTFKSALEGNPQLHVSVRSEDEYFRSQSKGTMKIVEKLGWPLAIAMALGALAGALNTMYSSVAARSSEIATLRTLGFGGASTFLATLAEALALAVVGAAAGTALGILAFNNLRASTLGANLTQVAFDLRVSGAMIERAWLLALAVGLIGGALPAWRAARRPIVGSLVAGGE